MFDRCIAIAAIRAFRTRNAQRTANPSVQSAAIISTYCVLRSDLFRLSDVVCSLVHFICPVCSSNSVCNVSYVWYVVYGMICR